MGSVKAIRASYAENLRHTPSNEYPGSYEKPEGHCTLDPATQRVVGCKCAEGVDFAHKIDLVGQLWVVYANFCESASSCPPTPVGRKMCLDKRCGINCEQSMCPDGASCEDVIEDKSACLFKA
ncbi:hypothetical protein FOL47_003127, partial [Perkinsus chesapeaki]